MSSRMLFEAGEGPATAVRPLSAAFSKSACSCATGSMGALYPGDTLAHIAPTLRRR